jgi:hypothetical protein
MDKELGVNEFVPEVRVSFPSELYVFDKLALRVLYSSTESISDGLHHRRMCGGIVRGNRRVEKTT